MTDAPIDAPVDTAVNVVLLDIEGTTTPVDYVFGVLFPFAKDQVAGFLQAQGHDPSVQADLSLLQQDYEADRAANLPVPEWNSAEPEAAIPYIHYLIAVDRKSTGLKSLQGKIWNQGYEDGTLKSQVFPDVQPAFERWTEAGKKLYIFSSGSIQAQKLLFRYSKAGDLTPFLSGYFDTQTGAKKEPSSYQKIAAAIGVSPNQILFISDVVAELQAAKLAGMQTLFSLRPGNYSSESEGFTVVRSFDGI